jgi:hypothetical protein
LNWKDEKMLMKFKAGLVLILAALLLPCAAIPAISKSAKKLEPCERQFNGLMRSGTLHKAAATSLGLKLFMREHGAMACGFAGRPTKAEAEREALRGCKASAKRNGDNRPCKIIFLK